jgi:putative tricarboxylic transport membrane protein
VGSEPDGHTITLVAAPSTVVTPLIQDVCYGPAHFATIGVITEVPSVLAVGAPSEFSDAAAFFAATRARPGELTVGTPGATTSQAIELRRPASEYGVKVTVVPFNGNAELIGALLGGTVDALLVDVSQDIRAQFDAGEFRPRGSQSGRAGRLPPGHANAGRAGLPRSHLQHLAVRAGGTRGYAPEIIAALEEAMRAGLADPDVRTQLDEAYVPDRFIGAAEFRAMLDEIVTVYGPVAKELRGG